MKSKKKKLRNPFQAMPQTPLKFNHSPQKILNPSIQDLYDMDHTCNHIFINLQFPFVFLHKYFAGHDCSTSPPFDVSPSFYFYQDITMT